MMSSTMEKILSSQASNWRESRRLRAFELKEQGWKQKQIAQALGVTEGAVSQWMKRAREQGVEGLRHKPPPGATPRLSEDQRARVPELLAQGAQAHGFRGEAWTCERVAIVIRREFGVSYHPAHVSRLLKALRQSLQKPQRRAEQRDEEAIERWKEQRWPSLKKGARGRQDHSVRRSVRLLPVAYGGSHLRSGGKDARPQGAPHARSPLRHERHRPRWQTLHDGAGACLQGRGRDAMPQALDVPDPRQAARHMGRLSDPSGRGSEGLPLERGFRAAATRTVAWLCSGSQPR